MENVARVQSHAVFKKFVEELERLDYTVAWSSLRCAEFGVPQLRRRLVLMAGRNGTVQLPSRLLTGGEIMTVDDAIGGLPAVKAGVPHPSDPFHVSRKMSPINLARIRASKAGGTWMDWPSELRSGCHLRPSGATFKNVYARMRGDEPSPTITTQFPNFGTGRFGHPRQDRGLTLREGAVLQSFPLNYRFVPEGGVVELQTVSRLIGNAVPPRLAKAIGVAFLQA
jgi:DNA (cytosine-5)-methyltransferase 1